MAQSDTKDTTNSPPAIPNLQEAKVELDSINERGEKIQKTISQLQAEYSQLNLRAAFLQGVIGAQQRNVSTPKPKTAPKK